MIEVIVEMRAFQWTPCRACCGTGRMVSGDSSKRVGCPACNATGRIGHHPPRERLVEISDDEWNKSTDILDRLSLVFKYGQNDFQPRPGYISMSVGDVARLPDGRRFRCDSAGWSQL
jgi:hypothetical protein